jgi:AAA15 family ATPase/GTPase
MLIEFTIGNYKSFKDKVTFSMVAANLSAKDKELDENNVFAVDGDLTLLKSAAIYGANASGKSNIAKALTFIKDFIINSSKETQSTDEINADNFRLSTETENQPSFFELIFLLNRQKYRYGFEVNQSRVISEWLFYMPLSREKRLFERNTDNFKISRIYKANRIQELTRNNALFLSVSAQFNVEIAKQILACLSKQLNIISGLEDDTYLGYTLNYLSEEENKNDVIQLIKKLDIGISGIEVGHIDITSDSLPDAMSDEVKKLIVESGTKGVLVSTIHKKFDDNGQHLSNEKFYLIEDESEGTQKVFALAGILIDTLKNGSVLIFDELDARLHPLLSMAIVQLFNSNETNPNNAQLIFMTHDTNLLSNKIFRRDQIWFTEKNKYGATDLYSLAEYKVRNDASFENDYIKGKYGAIPYIGNLNTLISTHE